MKKLSRSKISYWKLTFSPAMTKTKTNIITSLADLNDHIRSESFFFLNKPSEENYQSVLRWKKKYSRDFKVMLEQYKFLYQLDRKIRPCFYSSNEIKIGAYIEFGEDFNNKTEFLDEKLQSLKQCTCLNGKGATGTECALHNSAYCSTCNLGYHISSNATCSQNKCKCPNGIGATGTECGLHNSTYCSTCDLGYHITSNATCSQNKCNCLNGISATGKECLSHNSLTCVSCNSEYRVSNKKCLKKLQRIFYTRDNGRFVDYGSYGDIYDYVIDDVDGPQLKGKFKMPYVARLPGLTFNYDLKTFQII